MSSDTNSNEFIASVAGILYFFALRISDIEDSETDGVI